MASPVTTTTAIASFLGFISNSTILYLVLSERKRLYHLLFAGLTLTRAIWDLDIFLAKMRNSRPEELIVEPSQIKHLISIALVIAVFLPVKNCWKVLLRHSSPIESCNSD